MKIAVCVSGHARNYKKFVENFKNILKNNQLSIDFFVSVWDQVNWQKKSINLFGYNLFNINHQKLNIDNLNQAYKPVSMRINRSIDFSYLNLKRLAKSERYFPKDHKKKRSYEGIYSQYYLIDTCNELKKNHESFINLKYDLVIRTRPDFTLNEKIDFNKIFNNSNNTIYLLYQKTKKNDQKSNIITFTDVFAVSSSNNMNKLAKFHEYYLLYLEKYDNQRIEYLFENYIRTDLKLNVQGLDLSYSVANFTF